MISAKMKRLRKDLIRLWKSYTVEERLLGNFTRTMSRDEILTDFLSYVEEMLKVEETTNE